MTRRQSARSLGAGAAALSALIAAACGPLARPAEAPAGARGQAPVTLSWSQNFNPDVLAKEQPMVDAFRDKQPSITIERVLGLNTEKLLASLAGGAAPDTAWVEGADMPNVVSKGGIVEVTSFWRRDAREVDKDDFYPPTALDVTWQGKLWGTPFGTTPYQANYNKDLFTRSSVPLPGELAEKNQWTWANLIDIARRVTVRDAAGRASQLGVTPPTYFVGAIHWLWNNGGDVLNKERTQVVLDSAPNVEAIQFVVDLRWKHRAWGTADEIREVLAPTNDIRSGALGIEWYWHGGAPSLRNVATFDWDVVPNPRGKTGATSVVKGNGECILKGTKLVEEGWQWIKHIASKEGDAALVKTGRTVHRRKSTEVLFNREFHPPAGTKWIVWAYNNGRALPLVPAWTEMARVWGEVMGPVWNNQTSVREGLSEAARQMRLLLAGS